MLFHSGIVVMVFYKILISMNILVEKREMITWCFLAHLRPSSLLTARSFDKSHWKGSYLIILIVWNVVLYSREPILKVTNWFTSSAFDKSNIIS
jgi:hypothetical protein